MKTVVIRNQKGYTDEVDKEAFSVVRLNNSHIKPLGGTNKWVKITSEDGASIYRKIKGAGKALNIPMDALELDRVGLVELGWSDEKSATFPFFTANLSIRKVNIFERLLAHWYHPNPLYSVPMKLGYIGLGLGVFGFLLSGWSIYLTYNPPH